MDWKSFLDLVRDWPLIQTENLKVGIPSPRALEVQLSRWVVSGRLQKLKRGAYILSAAFRRVEPHPFFVAGVLKKPSYISLEKALEYHGLIPESVPSYTSITTKAPSRTDLPMGLFVYRHVVARLFWGYQSVRLNSQVGFIADPEKAWLDLIYLNHIRPTEAYLNEMRFQNLSTFNMKRLAAYAHRFENNAIEEAAHRMQSWIRHQKK